MSKPTFRKQKTTTLRVNEPKELMEFLSCKMGGMTRTSVKALLSRRQVQVNSRIETKYNYMLNPGDIVSINSGIANEELKHPKLKILYEDDAIIVVEKKEGLLTMATVRESDEMTAYSILKSHLKKGNPRAELYTVHRLDRETSGVLLFAKTKDVQFSMQSHWHEIVTKRCYVALVEGEPLKADDTIISWLTENKKSYKIHSSWTNNGGQQAITHYTVMQSNGEYSLLSVELETGRKNQIRVQLAAIGHPVVGDKKYGSGTTPIKRLALHAQLLEFIHPITHKSMRFETPVPKEFKLLLKEKQNNATRQTKA